MGIPADDFNKLLREAGGGKLAVFGEAQGYCILRRRHVEMAGERQGVHTKTYTITVEGARFLAVKVGDLGTAGGVAVRVTGHPEEAADDARLERFVVVKT